jgi:group I intron endonuclease
MEHNFNFIYITTNLINGKQYIGDHSCDNLEKDKYYVGSGNILYEAIYKYGKKNFKREILEFFPTKQSAFDAQEKYIIEYNTLTPNGYNISPKGGMNVRGCCSEETKRKISEANRGKDTWMKGKHHTEEAKEKLRYKKSDEHRRKIGLKSKGRTPMKVKHHTEEAKEKIRQARIGIKATDESRQKMSIAQMGEKNNMYGKSLYEHWVITFGEEIAKEKAKERSKKASLSLRGKKRTDEQRKNYRIGASKRIKKLCPYCNREIDPGNYKKYHGKNCKRRNIK